MEPAKESRKAEWIIVVLFLGLSIGAYIGRATAPDPRSELASRDTVIVTHIDTIVREKPVYIAKTVIDSILVPVPDTITIRDTLWAQLPREQKEYQDSSYHAWISGIVPALDSIHIFAPVQCVTVTERVPVEVSRKWSLSITAGYGVAVAGKQIQLAPFIGAGISYNIFSW